MNAKEFDWMPEYFVPSVYGGLLPAALSVEKSNANFRSEVIPVNDAAVATNLFDTVEKSNANFRNGYLTANEQTVERVVDRFQAAEQFAAAWDLRLLGQVAQNLLDLCILAEPNEPFDWAVIQNSITHLRSLLK